MASAFGRSIVGALVITLLAANCSCSHYSRVPPEAFREVKPSESRRWKIETDDRTVYLVARFTIADSTLVIEQFDPSVDSPSTTYPLATIMPYKIGLEHVRSIQKWMEVSEGEALLVSAVVAIAVVWVLVILWAHSLENSHFLN